MARKPTLAELAAPRAPGAQQAEDADGPAIHSGKAGRAGAQPDGRKGILIRVAPEGWRQLRDLAADLTLSSGQQVSMQTLIVDAINRLLKEHDRPPVA